VDATGPKMNKRENGERKKSCNENSDVLGWCKRFIVFPTRFVLNKIRKLKKRRLKNFSLDKKRVYDYNSAL